MSKAHTYFEMLFIEKKFPKYFAEHLMNATVAHLFPKKPENNYFRYFGMTRCSLLYTEHQNREPSRSAKISKKIHNIL